MDYNSNCFILYNYYYIDKNIIQFAPTIFYNPEYNYLYNIWTQKVTIPIYYNTNISNPYNVNNNINPSSINKIINDISSHNINPELYRGHPQGATCGTLSRPYKKVVNMEETLPQQNSDVPLKHHICLQSHPNNIIIKKIKPNYDNYPFITYYGTDVVHTPFQSKQFLNNLENFNNKLNKYNYIIKTNIQVIKYNAFNDNIIKVLKKYLNNNMFIKRIDLSYIYKKKPSLFKGIKINIICCFNIIDNYNKHWDSITSILNKLDGNIHIVGYINNISDKFVKFNHNLYTELRLKDSKKNSYGKKQLIIKKYYKKLNKLINNII